MLHFLATHPRAIEVLYFIAFVSVLAFLRFIVPRRQPTNNQPKVDGPNWRQAMLDHGCDKRVPRKFTFRRTHPRLVK